MNYLNKFRVVFLFLVFTGFTGLLLAQQAADTGGRITGKVTDSESGSPVDFASVALINKADGKTIRGTKTDLEGNFSIENIPYGTYDLRISFIGYKPFSKDPVQISASKKNISLGTIKLAETGAKVLQEVVVEGQKNTIQMGIDRKVFNVEQSLVSEGGSATDLLANIPSLSVDIDGNVSLRGTSSVRILIDGKPSAIGDITQFLQSMPASSIQNIELITNPSSKYDAEGQSGIINIVLKKNQKPGINGSVALTAGNQDNYNAGASLNYRSNKWNLYGNYSFRQANYPGVGFNNTFYPASNGSINNLSESRRQYLSNSGRLGVDFSPNEKTTIGVSGNISFRNNDRDEDLAYRYVNIPGQDERSTRTTRQDEKDKGYDLSLDFNRKMKRKGEVFTANLSYGSDKEDGIERFNQEFYATGTPINDPDKRINDTYEDGENINIQLDYTLPFNEQVKLEAGYRTSIRNNDESQISDWQNPQTSQWERDYDLTNDFELEDIVHAVYTNYQNQLTKNFGFQVGLRAEQAYLNTDLTAREAEEPHNSYTTPGRLDYFRIYPSVFLTQKLKGENQLQLSYTRRVNRPRGWQVNPFRDVSDPNNIRMGNPNLKPEDIHSFEFSYLKYWKAVTLTSSVYFRQVNDVVERYTSPVTDNNAATLTQFFNFSKNQAAGFEFITRAELSKALTLTGNVNLFYNKYSGFEFEDVKIDPSEGYNWNTNLTADIKFLKSFTAQLRGDYRAPSVVPQGKRKAMYGLDGAIRMDVLDRKGSISLNMRNILDSRKWSETTETDNFIKDFERGWMARMTSITFSYRFGKQDLNLRNRRNNPDRQEGGAPDEGMF